MPANSVSHRNSGGLLERIEANPCFTENAFVRTNWSPGSAFALVTNFARCTSPVTGHPNFTLGSLTVCPPTSATPASSHASRAPIKIERIVVKSSASAENAAILSAVRGLPHRIDIAQRIGCGNSPIAKWVIDHRRNEIHRLQHQQVRGVRPLKCRRIIQRFGTDNDPLISSRLLVRREPQRGS